MSAACEYCRFWVTRSSTDMRGACHRYPPLIVQGRMTPPSHARPDWVPRPEHYFPMTMHDQWCGEFQPIPQQPFEKETNHG